MPKHVSNLWEIDLADGWETEQSKHCVTIFHPDGVGALQISAYSKRGNFSREDLLEATSLDDETRLHLGESLLGQFKGFQLVYAEDETFWRKWWLAESNVLVFITYNCAHIDNHAESVVVNQMVTSLRRTRPNSSAPKSTQGKASSDWSDE